MNKPINSETLYIGIDGGGTKCRARVEDPDGNFLAEGLGGPANIIRGLAVTTNSTMQSVEQALGNCDLPLAALSNAVVGIGLAGANVPSAKQSFLEWRHPFLRLHVTTDMHIACLGAHKGTDGAVIICGTGFNAGLCKDNNCTEIGGYGLLLADHASGAGIGLQAIRTTLEALDGIRSTSKLSDAVMAYLQCDCADALVEKSINAQPSYFAELAPLVLNVAKEDAEARRIVEFSASYADKYVRRLNAMEPERIAMIGGLAQHLFDYLSEDVKALIAPVLEQPEQGAIMFAKLSEG